MLFVPDSLLSFPNLRFLHDARAGLEIRSHKESGRKKLCHSVFAVFLILSLLVFFKLSEGSRSVRSLRQKRWPARKARYQVESD